MIIVYFPDLTCPNSKCVHEFDNLSGYDERLYEYSTHKRHDKWYDLCNGLRELKLFKVSRLNANDSSRRVIECEPVNFKLHVVLK